MYRFLLLFFLIACSKAQEAPKSAEWSFDYKTTAGTTLDSSDVVFRLYQSDNAVDYVLLGTTPDTTYYLLQHEQLYSNIWRYLRVTAYRMDVGIEGSPSDTTKSWFPVLKPGVPYYLKVIKTK
jgi:hypothetical protein